MVKFEIPPLCVPLRSLRLIFKSDTYLFTDPYPKKSLKSTFSLQKIEFSDTIIGGIIEAGVKVSFLTSFRARTVGSTISSTRSTETITTNHIQSLSFPGEVFHVFQA